jgi:uncharacterized cupredoxin-like copper-binding protein
MDGPDFRVSPIVIRALAGEPKFVMFMNTSNATHRFVSVGQRQNFDVTIRPREVKSVEFVAGRPGRYEFACQILGHEFSVPPGSIQVR